MAAVALGATASLAEESTATSYGNQSPAITNAQSVTINYNAAGITSAEVIKGTREQVQQLLPELQKLVDAKLSRILSEQRQQGTRLREIRTTLLDAIHQEVAALNANLAQASTSAAIAKLRDELYSTTTKLESIIKLDSNAKCSSGSNCVRLGYEGSEPAVQLEVTGESYSQAIASALDVNAIAFTCEDTQFSHDSIYVDGVTNVAANHKWVSALRLVRQTVRSSRLHATFSFTPRAACDRLRVVVYAVNAAGEIHDTAKTLTVQASRLTIARNAFDLDDDTLSRDTAWEFDERHILPFIPVSGKPWAFQRNTSEIYVLDGYSLVRTGRTLWESLQALSPPPPLAPENYRTRLADVAWDYWAYSILSRRDFRPKNGYRRSLDDRIGDFCQGLMESFTSEAFRSGAVEEWAERCRKIASKAALAIEQDKHRPDAIAMSFSQEYPSKVLEFDGGTLTLSTQTYGWRDHLQQTLPSERAEEAVYVTDGHANTEAARIRVKVYKQANIWFSTAVGPGFVYGRGPDLEVSFLYTAYVGAPVLWDVFEVDAGISAIQQVAPSLNFIARLSMTDLIALIFPMNSIRQLITQPGFGLDVVSGRPIYSFLGGYSFRQDIWFARIGVEIQANQQLETISPMLHISWGL